MGDSRTGKKLHGKVFLLNGAAVIDAQDSCRVAPYDISDVYPSTTEQVSAFRPSLSRSMSFASASSLRDHHGKFSRQCQASSAR